MTTDDQVAVWMLRAAADILEHSLPSVEDRLRWLGSGAIRVEHDNGPGGAFKVTATIDARGRLELLRALGHEPEAQRRAASLTPGG